MQLAMQTAFRAMQARWPANFSVLGACALATCWRKKWRHFDAAVAGGVFLTHARLSPNRLGKNGAPKSAPNFKIVLGKKHTKCCSPFTISMFSMLREMRLRRTSNTLCGVVCRLLQSQTLSISSKRLLVSCTNRYSIEKQQFVLSKRTLLSYWLTLKVSQ